MAEGAGSGAAGEDPGGGIPHRLRRRMADELGREPEPRTARPAAAQAPESGSDARTAGGLIPASAPLAPELGGRRTPAAASSAGAAAADPDAEAAAQIAPPQFIPARNPRPEELERRLAAQREAELRARSSSDEVLPADRGRTGAEAPAGGTAAARAARRARRAFRSWALAAAGALAVAGFAAGMLLDPFADRAPGAEASAIPIAHPSPEGIPPAQLEPGQCLAEWTGPWAASFATTDCTGEHAAQLLAEVPAAPFAGGPYPGEDALESRAQYECQRPEVLDPAASSALAGLTIDVAYAPSAAEWDAGSQSYRCFASLASGGMLTGSLAAPSA